MSTLPGFALVLLSLATHSAAADGLALKKDVELGDSSAAGKSGPMFLAADRIESNAPYIVEASGHVEARQAGQNFFADWLRYDTSLSTVEARGQVRMEQPALLLSGDWLRFNLDNRSGELTQPVYRFTEQSGRGHAGHLAFADENHFTLQDATYTTCPVGNDDWFLKTGKLDIDKTRNLGTARNTSLQFFGVPILYTPWISFPLSNERKTGVLAPTIGTTERSGLDLMVPYYFNLAPNYDATLYPRLLTKRGMQLGGEFRYLLDSIRGENRFEYLPNDNQTSRSRWSGTLSNAYQFNANTQAGMLFNRVSDDDYFRDLSNLISITSLSHLNSEVWVASQHANWNAELRAQSFQTLQDSTAGLIAEPYARLPHARLGMVQTLGSGLEFKLEIGRASCRERV